MDSLKEFLNKFFCSFDVVEDEQGTRVEFNSGSSKDLYFYSKESTGEYLGTYYDEEEGRTLHVFEAPTIQE